MKVPETLEATPQKPAVVPHPPPPDEGLKQPIRQPSATEARLLQASPVLQADDSLIRFKERIARMNLPPEKQEQMAYAFTLPANSNDDAFRSAANILSRIESYDGSIYTPDRKPLAPKDHYNMVKKVWEDGVAVADTPAMTEWLGIDYSDHASRLAKAKEGLGMLAVFSDAAGEMIADHYRTPYLSDSELSGVPDEDELRELNALFKQYQNEMDSDNRPYTTRPETIGQLVRDERFANHHLLQPIDDETRQKLLSAEEKIAAFRQRTNENSLIARYESKLLADNVLRHYEIFKPHLSDEADAMVRRNFVNHGMRAEDVEAFKHLPFEQQRMVAALANSSQAKPAPTFGRFFWEAGEQFVNMALDIPKAVWDRVAVDSFKRVTLDDEEYQRWAQTKALLNQAMQPKQADWNYLQRTAIAAFANTPYMLTTGGLHLAGRAAAKKATTEVGKRMVQGAFTAVAMVSVASLESKGYHEQVAAGGGDVSGAGYLIGLWSAGFASAAVEQLQIMSLTQHMSPYDIRRAYRAILNKSHAWALAKEFAGETLEQSAEEILQDGVIQAAFTSYHLDEEVLKSVIANSIETAYEVVGTMGWTTLGGMSIGGARSRMRPQLSNAELISGIMQSQDLLHTLLLEQDLSKRQAMMQKWREFTGPLIINWMERGNEAGAIEHYMGVGFDEKAARTINTILGSAYAEIMNDKNLTDADRQAIFGQTKTMPEILQAVFPGTDVITNNDGSFELTLTPFGLDNKLSIQFVDEVGIDINAPGAAASIEEASGGAVTAEQFLAMSDVEKQAEAAKYKSEGYIRFSLKAAGGEASAAIDENTLQVLNGEITLDKHAHPGAVFHEMFHGLVRFLQESGSFSESDIAKLQEEFGAPREGTQEVFNEERAAERFREYLGSGRLAYSHETMLERLGTKIHDLLSSIKNIRQHQTRNETIADALFGQIVEGNYQGIPVGSITTEQRAQNAATRQTDSPASPPEGGQGDNPPGSGNPPPPSPPPSGPPPTPIVPTGEWQAVTPDGKHVVGGEWVVMDLDDLKTSDQEDYPQELQPRDRGNVSSRVQVHSIARNLQPARLFESSETDGGSPIITPEGNVLSGNGRVMAMREARTINTLNPYTQAVRQKAAELGIEIPDGIKTPVLVRRVDTVPAGTSINEIAELSNRNKILSRSEAEQAEADAKTILDRGLLMSFAPGADGNILTASNRPFINGFVAATGDASLLDSNGNATDAAEKRIKRAMLAIVIGTGEEARDVVRALVENAGSVGMRREVDGVMRAAGDLVRLAELKPQYSLLDDVSMALRDYLEMRTAGQADATAWLAQQELFGAGRPESVQMLMRAMSDMRTATGVSDMLLNYTNRARLEGTSTQDMFGEPDTAKETLLQRAIDEVRQAENTGDRRDSFIFSASSPNARKAMTFKEAKTAARAFIGKDLFAPHLGMHGIVSGNSISKMLNEKAVGKSISPQIQSWCVANLDSLFENAELDIPHDDIEGNTNIGKIHRVYSAAEVNGNLFPVKITIKELRPQKRKDEKLIAGEENLNNIYSVEAIKIETLAGKWVDAMSEMNRPISTPQAGVSADTLRRWWADVKRQAENAGDRRDSFTGRELYLDESDFTPDGQVKPAVLEEIAAERTEIERTATANGTWLKAPNGKDTNLAPEQWTMVRTRRFKEWFGDWEHDPANASKVVDANDEPLVVYHGTPYYGFTEFDKSRLGERDRGDFGTGFYFTPNEAYAATYGVKGYWNFKGDKSKVYKCFVRLKNPAIVSTRTKNVLEGKHSGDDIEHAMLMDKKIDGVIAKLSPFDTGHDDGVWRISEIVAHNPTQIKSATDNVGTFDGNNPDIRYSMVPGHKNLLALHNLSPEQLAGIFELGGLPAPSIAVVKEPHAGFGNTTLLFDKSTIDPKNSVHNKLYGTDKWTPTFPSVAYRVDDAKMREIRTTLEGMLGEDYQIDYDWDASENLEKRLESYGGLEKLIKYDSTLKAAFAKANGVDVRVGENESAYQKEQDVIDPFIESNRESYEAWAGTLLGGLVKRTGIWNRNDPYTPSGNRRPWEALHDPVTLENVVRIMRKEAKDQSHFHTNSFRHASAREIRSLKSLKENAERRMRRLDASEFDALKDEFDSRTLELANRLMNKEDARLWDIDNAVENMGDAMRMKTPARILAELKTYYPAADEALVADMLQLAYEIAEMPVDYFEAKPYRGVGLDEVKGVVIPTGNDALVDALAERDIRVLEYEPGNEADRTQKIQSLADELDVRFSAKKKSPSIREQVTVEQELSRSEAKAELEKLAGRDLVNDDQGFQAQVNSEQRNKLISPAAAAKSETNGFSEGIHNAAAAKIDALWKHAVLISTSDDEGGDQNLKIHRFASPVIINDATAIAYITGKESSTHGHRVYSLELQEIKMLRDIMSGMAESNSKLNRSTATHRQISGNHNSVQNVTPVTSHEETIQRILDKVNPPETPEDSDRRDSWVYVGDKWSPESRAVASLAAIEAAGKRPTTTDAEKIIRLNKANITTDDALGEAKELLKSNVGRLVQQAFDTHQPTRAWDTLADAAERRRFAQRFTEKLIQSGMEEGVGLGRNTMNAEAQALKKLLLDARGEDLKQLIMDTGIDLTETLMQMLPSMDEDSAGGEDDEGRSAGQGERDEPPAADPDVLAERTARMQRIIEAVRAEMDARQAAREKAEAEAAENEDAEDEEGPDEGGGGGEGGDASLAIPKELLEGEAVDLRNPAEMAFLMRIWIMEWLIRQSEGRLNPSNIWKDREAVEQYRKTMIQQLQDMAHKLIVPRDYALTTIQDMIDDIPSTARANTIELRTSFILDVIYRNAIRQSQYDLTKELSKDLKTMAEKGKELEPLGEDLKRKVTAETEKSIRYIRRIIWWSPRMIEQEAAKLQHRINEQADLYQEVNNREATAKSVDDDVKYHDAMLKMQLLNRWAGLKYKMPSEIISEGEAIKEWLLNEQEVIHGRWLARAEVNAAMQDALMTAIVPNDVRQPRKKDNVVDDFLTSILSTVRQRLERLTFNASTPAAREAALEAVNTLMRALDRGAEVYGERKTAYIQQWQNAVLEANGGSKLKAAAYMARLDEAIPEEISSIISLQGYNRGKQRMTWGQALQLYVSLTQAYYRDNVIHHQRQNHAALIESIMTPEDVKLVRRVRAIYESRRDELSVVMQDVTGMPVWRPDPLYMPVQMYTGSKGGLGMYGAVMPWSPFAASLTPRIRNKLDFDESVGIADMYFQRAEDTARAIGYGSRGLVIRGVLGKKTLQDTIERYYGKKTLTELLKHVSQSMTGVQRAPSNKAVSWLRHTSTMTALSWNFLSSSKQVMSLPMLAARMDGGFKDLFSCILNFDRAAMSDVMQSDGYKARYGGQLMPEFAEIMFDKRSNWIKRFYQLGMSPIQVGDYLAFALVVPGYYKSLRNAYRDQGMDDATAKERALTDTWGIVEETQQSGRVHNLSSIYRDGSELTKLFGSFASSPLLQLSHEYHAFNEARAGVPGGKGRLVRAVALNHVIIPGLMAFMTYVFNQLLLGREPPDDDDEKNFLRRIMEQVAKNALVEPVSRLLIGGALMETMYNAAVEKKSPYFSSANLLPSQSVIDMFGHAAIAPRHLMEQDMDAFQQDLLRFLSSASAPIRHGRHFWENRIAQ